MATAPAVGATWADASLLVFSLAVVDGALEVTSALLRGRRGISAMRDVAPLLGLMDLIGVIGCYGFCGVCGTNWKLWSIGPKN